MTEKATPETLISSIIEHAKTAWSASSDTEVKGRYHKLFIRIDIEVKRGRKK